MAELKIRNRKAIANPLIDMRKDYNNGLPNYYEGEDSNVELWLNGHGENPIRYEWERKLNNGNWEVFSTEAVPSVSVLLQVGRNTFRLRLIHERDVVKYSNEVVYVKQESVQEPPKACKRYVVTAYTDSFVFSYIDCSGVRREVDEYSHYQEQHSRTVCAQENSIEGERLDITEIGDC